MATVAAELRAMGQILEHHSPPPLYHDKAKKYMDLA